MIRRKNYLRFFMIYCLSLTWLLGCGVSKDNSRNTGGPPLPDFGEPGKKVEDKNTLTLKAEELKLTHVSQAWKLNSLNQEVGADKYLKLQKRFASPIQFNGWMTLDRIEHSISHCVQPTGQVPVFILEDDHGGAVVMPVGEKVTVSLEKLYTVRAEFFNDSFCRDINVQFGILYGTNE